MSRLLDAAGDAPFVFVVGKGGVGKTTAAGAFALELADSGTPAHLISTDPAHSLGDLFGHAVGGVPVESACSPLLLIEEFDAARAAREWLDRALGPVTDIVEGGTYLDGEDVTAFSRLALPGIDEMMAVLRLVDLQETSDRRRVVVDTAPTGHTLRLLDAADTHAAIAEALRAMADKAAAVAGAMTGRAVRMRGEDIIDQLDHVVSAWHDAVLSPAAFIVASRPGSVVEAETGRLLGELESRTLRVAALLETGGGAPAAGRPYASVWVPQVGSSGRAPQPPGATRILPAGAVLLDVPWLVGASSGCDGLRAWRRHVSAGRNESGGRGPASGEAAATGPGPVPPPGGAPALRPGGRGPAAPAGGAPTASRPGGPPGPAASSAGPAADWLEGAAQRLLLFAGKGGVGKSSCAAAAALALAGNRSVLLCSTDPAGSLGDLLGDPSDANGLPARLRVLQIDPASVLTRLRDGYQEEVVVALEGLGLTRSAALDRRVIETLWNLTPPGLDELAATAAMLGAAADDEFVVIDSAPTGHFLRLLEMPEVALGWTRQLMRVFVKYGISGVAGGAAESLLELSRDLRELRDALHDPASTSVIVVTLDEPMVQAETERLRTALTRTGIRVAAVLVNRHTHSHEDPGADGGAGRADDAGRASPTGDDVLVEPGDDVVVIHAPALDPSPVGAVALRGFVDTWNIVR